MAANTNQDSSTHEPSDATSTRLVKPWVWLARIVWGILFIVGFILIIKGIQARIDLTSVPCEALEDCIQLQPSVEGARLLVEKGYSLRDYGTIVAVVEIFTALIFTGAGLVIFWRRSDDRMALYASVALMFFGTGATAFLLALKVTEPGLSAFINLWQIFGLGWFVLLGIIFPNGRFTAKWTRWVTIAIEISLFTLFYLGQHNSVLFVSVLMLASILGIWSQVDRYRNYSGPVERQQTKWVVLGFSSFFTGVLFMGIPPLLFPSMVHPINVPPSTIYDFIYLIPYNIIFAFIPWSILPITFAVSMLRTRLWDVDPIINRSLVYGGLTVVLGAVFAGGFFGMRGLLEGALGGEQAVMAATVSAGAVVGLFTPTRTKLRRFVDKRFYGIELDYREAIKEYDRQGRRVHTTHILESFGSYTNLELLGRGGMGEVYLGQHPTMNKAVAIKLLPDSADGQVELSKRFMREAQTISTLKHNNIVALYDYGEQDGTPFMVMEYIDGKDLSLIISEREWLPLDEVLPYLRDIAAALDYAHTQGVIHRDIKPSNVMIEQKSTSHSNSSQRAVLMDFGIAHIASAMTQLTGTGSLVGTLDYISPEQIQGASEVDTRADVYSMGVMTYQLLAGSTPFRANNPGGIVVAHLMQPAPDVREIAPEIPKRAALAIQKAMSKRPRKRFATAGEFISELEA